MRLCLLDDIWEAYTHETLTIWLSQQDLNKSDTNRQEGNVTVPILRRRTIGNKGMLRTELVFPRLESTS